MIAVDVGIAGEIFRTSTLGLMSDHSADGVIGARIGHCARANALTITAALIVRAIVVGTASWIFDWNC